MTDNKYRTLRDLLEASGVPLEDVERAEADGTLGLLAIDQMILGDQGPRYTRAELEARTGLGDDAARFWRALGLTAPPANEVAFSTVDVEILQLVNEVLRLGLIERDVALQMARVIGSSISRLASAPIDALQTP